MNDLFLKRKRNQIFHDFYNSDIQCFNTPPPEIIVETI